MSNTIIGARSDFGTSEWSSSIMIPITHDPRWLYLNLLFSLAIQTQLSSISCHLIRVHGLQWVPTHTVLNLWVQTFLVVSITWSLQFQDLYLLSPSPSSGWVSLVSLAKVRPLFHFLVERKLDCSNLNCNNYTTVVLVVFTLSNLLIVKMTFRCKLSWIWVSHKL